MPGHGLRSIELETEYRTGESDPIQDFYRPCLAHANVYSRAVGYFRSSIFIIVGEDVIDFAKRGGKIRLICSPSLASEDANSIEEGYLLRQKKISDLLCNEINELLMGEMTESRTRILATLIAVGALDIKIAVRKNGEGIYHEKIGIFADEFSNTISFIGSANETWSGWHQRGNLEALEVFSNWSGGTDAFRCKRHEENFNRLWKGDSTVVDVMEFPEVARKLITSAAFESLDVIDKNEIVSSKKIKKSVRQPMPHQVDAIEGWHKRGCRGILEHATGSGKTVTALIAIREHVDKGLPALVVVPSRLLLTQWEKEVKEEIPEATVLLAGGGNTSWRQSGRLSGMTDQSRELGKRVIIATMQTASSEEFRLKLKTGHHLLVVADEVHQSGSPQNSNLFRIESGPRLGVSATPVRYGDPHGTEKIFDYFGETIPPVVSLQDAIKSGRLVEYEYVPHPVHLTATEIDTWNALTKQIRFEVAKLKRSSEGQSATSEFLQMLLIKRSRVAKKALNKISLARDVLRDNFHDDHRWLIYCEDKSQLQDVINELKSVGLNPLRYHTDMDGDKEATLDHFKNFGGILASIKCLDEGVDIPLIDHALILASSQNPRQFIQRRGRVLRKAKWKNIAVIHDAIVVPVCLEEEPEQTSLVKSEFLRAIEFADSAINPDASVELRSIAANLGFDPDKPIDIGLEEDEL